MLAEIAEAVETTLKAAGLRFALVDVHGQDPDKDMPSPAALIFVDSGEIERLTPEKWKVSPEITVALVLKDMGREKTRRSGISALIEGVITALAGQKLGLDIQEIQPQGFRNVTDKELAELGLMVFALRLKTSFTASKPDDEADAEDLIRIGLNYFLQDPADDAVADASDLIGQPLPPDEPQPGTVGPVTYVGEGPNDLTISGDFWGGVQADFVVEIQYGGEEPINGSYRWSADGGATWADPDNIGIDTGNPYLLGDYGLSVVFGSGWGHATGDRWSFTATPA